MGKSSEIEKAKRVNIAMAILRDSESLSQAATTLAEQQHLSKRQAYRYLSEASQLERAQPVPARKVVFTVKLPIDLVEALRENARAKQRSLSALTAQAIRAFLSRRQGG